VHTLKAAVTHTVALQRLVRLGESRRRRHQCIERFPLLDNAWVRAALAFALLMAMLLLMAVTFRELEASTEAARRARLASAYDAASAVREVALAKLQLALQGNTAALRSLASLRDQLAKDIAARPHEGVRDWTLVGSLCDHSEIPTPTRPPLAS
jgi:hypothetical protein